MPRWMSATGIMILAVATGSAFGAGIDNVPVGIVLGAALGLALLSRRRRR